MKKIIPNTNFSLTNLNITGIIGFGDLHEELDALDEIDSILEEFCEIAKENKCNIGIQLGDWCDKVRLYGTELYRMVGHAKLLKDLFELFIILKGNHDTESTQISIIDFLEYFGIKIANDETLLKTKFGNILLGHWFLKESKDAFGTHQRYTLEELKKKYPYDYCLIGHQHDFQKIDEKTYHVGSSRYVNFGENADLKKRVFIINEKGLQFIELKSVIPIYNVSTLAELEKVPERAKVRYIFKSFESLKNDLKTVDNIKDKFHSFKKKLDFSIKTDLKLEENTTVKKTEKEIITNWLSKIQDPEVRRLLEEQFSNLK